MIAILFVLTILTLLYVYIKWNYTYWNRKRVPGPEPTFLVGNIGPTLNYKKHFAEVLGDMYKQYSNVPYVGFYRLVKPEILVRDPDLIKDILVKNYHSFRKNGLFPFSEDYDPVILKNPFFAVDEIWKESRRRILQAFSSGKIKAMFPAMNDVGKEMIGFIKDQKTEQDVDAKELSIRFMTQNVIRTTFSIDSFSFNKNRESEFMKINELFEPALFDNVKFLGASLLPQWLLDILPISFMPKETKQLFERLVAQNEKSRINKDQVNDIFQTLLQGQDKEINSKDQFLLGHIISLFLDNAQTAGTALSYALYELAANQRCQDNLFKEITDTICKFDDEIEAISAVQKLAYFEAIIMETMRLHPPFLLMMKICTEKYELPKNCYQTEPLTIYPGAAVHVSLLAVHMDEKHYPNPTEFRPERFIGEENLNGHKDILSFGAGPRMCVGVRFVLAQMKTAIMHIIKNYRIRLSPNQKPIEISPHVFVSTPKDGISLRFEAR